MEYYIKSSDCIKSSDHIFAGALPRREISAKLDETTRTVIQHIIKVLLFPKSPKVPDWKQEVYDGLHNVSLIKGTNRLPSDRFILKNTIERYKQFIPVWQYNIVTDYYIIHGYPVEIPYDHLEKKIKSYYQWLAGQLTVFGDVARTDVYDKLKSLGEE